jgi:plasmid stabilization system protein ParE
MARSESLPVFSVFFSPRAKADVEEALSYVARDLGSPLAAQKMADEFDAQVSRLDAMPYAFRFVNDERLASQGYRRFTVGNYLGLFRILESSHTVVIDRVIYGKSDWSRRL